MSMMEIRCPTERKHSAYDTCGSILGGIGENSIAIFRCSVCKSWWRVESFDDIILERIEKGKVDLVKSIRSVLNGE